MEEWFKAPDKSRRSNTKADRDTREAERFRLDEALVKEVRDDFWDRCRQRRQYEAQWQLNTNFVHGNQYCGVNAKAEVEDFDRDYFWQEREVFNHIASIMESRLSKLAKVRPKMSVRPASSDDGDIKTSKVATKILDSVYHKFKMDSLIAKATMWSELTGSVFYKISWSDRLGRLVGYNGQNRPVYEGDVRIDVCPPYELFPDNVTALGIEECSSIIHAKSVHINEIYAIWGKQVQPEETEVVDSTGMNFVGGLGAKSAVPRMNRSKKPQHAIVIERYSRPTYERPDGELVITAGGRLLHRGPLPYINGNDEKRDFPFVKQDALQRAGCFFGVSMIERAIPIQRAYNAVKNRKREFLSRIAMGVLAVEDGSVDTMNLEEEGLSPGKILVYRQGSTPPRLLDTGRVPMDFLYEEDRLLSEFISISGVSEMMRSSSVPASLSSGIALQLLLDQDDTRLSTTAERVREAVRAIGQHTLRLYKQFASQTRLSRVVGSEGEVEIISWNSSDISCDDVILSTENELNTSQAARQNMIFELLRSGLLTDENGKISDTMRSKILDALGYGNWEITRDAERMQAGKADKENIRAQQSDPEVCDIDDHDIHISEHTKYLLSAGFDTMRRDNPKIEERLLSHIRSHKQAKKLEAELSSGGIV